MTGARTEVVCGFIPLLDSAVLVAAARRGFAEAAGLNLKLVRETSWANIRDRISVGHFDVAHMLAPMPIAATLNLTSLAVPMRAPMVLGLGGNAITVSNAIAAQMADEGWDGATEPADAGAALARVVERRSRRSADRIRLGVVHPFSGHAYELRYWLAAAGINPDQDVEIAVLPPRVMPDALSAGQLDGYCVGEPWSSAAVAAGIGRIATYKQKIWPDSPEKVLAATSEWAAANNNTLVSLIKALSDAAEWCAAAENANDLAMLMSGSEFLDCEPEVCLPALTGVLRLGNGKENPAPGLFQFVSGQSALPRRAHGLWFYSQMVRWHQAEYSEEQAKLVEAVFDDAISRQALDLSRAESHQPGLGVSFFDGRPFDPDALADYVGSTSATS